MPGWSTEGKPDWSNDQETADQNQNNEPPQSATNVNTMTSDHVVRSSEAESPPRKRVGLLDMGICCISIIFLIFFIAGAIYFDNDTSVYDRQWIVYYSYQASIAAMSIISRLACKNKCENFVNALATGGLIWSITLIAISSMNLRDLNTSISFDDMTGDQDEYDLSVAVIGLINCVFHMMLYCCCSTRG